MPVPKHYLAQFGGGIVGGEIWTCGIRMHSDASAAILTANQGTCDDVAGDILQWFASSEMNFSNQVTLRWVKFNKIGPDGLYENKQKVFIKEYPSTTTGTATGSMMPAQLSMVVSFGTGERGPRNRGRLYCPPMGSTSLDTNGQITASRAQQVANRTALLLNNLNNWPGVDAPFSNLQPPNCAVVSEVGNHAKKITEVRVGRAWDTQTRRRGKIPENYVVATTAIG